MKAGQTKEFIKQREVIALKALRRWPHNMSNLIVRSLLFNPGCSLGWYAGCGDGVTVSQQNAAIDQLDKYGCNAAAVNIMNEDVCSPFDGTYMDKPLKFNQRKLDLFFGFAQRLKARGKKVAVVFFDGCEENAGYKSVKGAKYPYHKYPERHQEFLKLATENCRSFADAFLLGIETNRYFPIEIVEFGISYIKQFAYSWSVDGKKIPIPVGTHEQNVSWKSGKPYLRRRIPFSADFHGFETSNHPHKGDSVSVSNMKREVECLVAGAGGKPVWVMESNSSKGDHAKAQNRALAEIPGVIGVDGVM